MTDKPTILVIDDEQSLLDLYEMTLVNRGFRVQTATSSERARQLIQDHKPALVVSDVRMPGEDGISFMTAVKERHPELPFLLVTAYANIKDAVTSLKLGAVDYLEKPIDLDELIAAITDTLGCRKQDAGAINLPSECMRGIVAESRLIQAIYADAHRIAKSKATVLITGESGTGKEVIADFIHKNSERATSSFVAVNCASIPSSLIASELFGHEKGAFTGAYAAKNGYFQDADKGTLFLDEIGDMPLELQPALLRAIETGRILSVGSTTEKELDFRLVAATNKNLSQAVKEGSFREDLYYRLNVITLELPPLRDHMDDVIPLTRFFLKKFGGKSKKTAAATNRLLLGYHWPGNIRELANAIERAVVLSRTDMIMPDHLPPDIRKSSRGDLPSSQTTTVTTLEQMEIKMIKQALEQTKGNQTKAAELLGISRRTLINKMKRYPF